eukprot:jgi/Picsp_1/3939/NSC_01451-R1_---NA---
MEKGKDAHNRKVDGSATRQATLLTGSECLERDCKRLRSMQIFTGFGNIEDAVTRLLPFHAIATQDVLDEDYRNMHASKSMLVDSRYSVWQAQLIRRANSVRRRCARIGERLKMIDSGSLREGKVGELVLHACDASVASYAMGKEEQKAIDARMKAQAAARDAERAKLVELERERTRQREEAREAAKAAAEAADVASSLGGPSGSVTKSPGSIKLKLVAPKSTPSLGGLSIASHVIEDSKQAVSTKTDDSRMEGSKSRDFSMGTGGDSSGTESSSGAGDAEDGGATPDQQGKVVDSGEKKEEEEGAVDESKRKLYAMLEKEGL